MRGAMALAILLLPAFALAQERVMSFDQLGARLKAGEAVRVMDTMRAARYEGGCCPSNPARLSWKERRDVRSCAKRMSNRSNGTDKDSGVQGLLLGAGAGALGLWGVAVAGDREMATDPEVLPSLLVLGAAGGALVGYIIDRVIPGRQTVYFRAGAGATPLTLAVIPAITPHTRGLALSFSF